MNKIHSLNPSDVARILNVNAMTVRRMSDKGLLKFSVTPGGHRRYELKDVQTYCEAQGIAFQNVSAEQKRVLIVDDDSQTLNLLHLFLRSLDSSIEVDTANDGFDAGFKVMDFKPQVIVTDLLMPKVNGIEVCRHIKAHEETKHIHVVGITGSDDENLRQKFLSAGGIVCILKPLNKKEFNKIIGDLL